MPVLAHPGSAQGQCILAPSSPRAEPAPSQCPGSRVPQLLLGFSVEPRWGLMGDCQAPLNRILIIQLQQEFFPPGLGPSQIPPSLPQHLPSPRSLLSQAPGASPTQRGGLWPISWGPGRAWHLPPAITGRTAPARGESPAVGGASEVYVLSCAWPDLTLVLGKEGVPTLQLGVDPAHFSRVIVPHARPFHNARLM